MQITVGADPEFFLSKEGQYVSAHDLVPGTKDKPYPLKNGAVQADGTAVEFNIDPAKTEEEFCTNIESVLKQLREMIDPVFKFEFKPSVKYDPDYFRRIPIYAKRLGCDPDFSSFTGRQNPRPKPVGTLRTGAGHIHVGWGDNLDIGNSDHLWDCRQVISYLDLSLGTYLRYFDKDKERQNMYGKEGAFRPKPYGVEYRVPSNDWLNRPKLWPFIFHMVQHVLEKMNGGYNPVQFSYGSKENLLYYSETYYQYKFPCELLAE